MTPEAIAIQSKIRHGLIPAVPVPFRNNGTLDEAAQRDYANWMASQTIAGVAVWAHTGRGLNLDDSLRAGVLASWRAALPNKIIIAGAGGSREAGTDEAYIASAQLMARQAALLGANAILAYAPLRFRDRQQAEQERLILQYHEAIQQAGLPMMLFYLYREAGGIAYSDQMLTSLFQLPMVFGIKIATLDSVVTFQHISSLIAGRHPEQLLVTGEDRFLGYSLMMGAEAALIGMGAALTRLQSDLLTGYFEKDFARFHSLSTLVDRFAEVTFSNPVEGYIARMLRVLAIEGVIPQDSAYDPWGPQLSNDERDSIDKVLTRIKIDGNP